MADPQPVGRSISVFYKCTDNAGSTDVESVAVTVTEPDPDLHPVLVLPVSSVTIGVGGQFTPPAATCTDAEDGDISHGIDVDQNGLDQDSPGTYTVFYRCTDSAGNTDVESVAVTVLDG